MDYLEIATSFGRCKTTNTVVIPIYKENKENKKKPEFGTKTTF